MLASGSVTHRAGYVLAGGRSSRFGQDKALYAWDGRPLAVRAAEVVRESAGRVALVGSKARYGALGYAVVEDPVENAGPLAGIVAALTDSPAEWTAVLACDLPNVGVDLLDALFERAAASAADGVVVRQVDGRDQPLCAVYSRRLATPLAESLAAGERKVLRALEPFRLERLPVGSAAALVNANTPSDLPPLIRDAVPADIPAILEIQAASRPEASDWKADSYHAAIEQGWCGRRVWVAAIPGREGLAGFLFAQPIGCEEAEVINLAVAPEARRSGAASALLRRAFETFPVEWALEVRESNHVARAFYARRGFRESGRRPAYYHRPVEDAIVMQRTKNADLAERRAR